MVIYILFVNWVRVWVFGHAGLHHLCRRRPALLHINNMILPMHHTGVLATWGDAWVVEPATTLQERMSFARTFVRNCGFPGGALNCALH